MYWWRRSNGHGDRVGVNTAVIAAIPSEKPRHPERSEGSPESGSVPYLEDLHGVHKYYKGITVPQE